MVEAAEATQRFVARRTRADLDTDQMLLFALVHAITVIGEAASKIAPKPEQRFRQCRGMRSFPCGTV
jgi:uncharacterized protein with HEPN domain